MLTLRLLLAMLTGRAAHWERIETMGLGELLESFQAESGARGRVANRFLIAANVILKDLVMNFRGAKLPVKVNPKSLSAEQVRDAHKILLAFFVAVYAAANPEMKSEMQALLANPVLDPALTKELLSAEEEAKRLAGPEPPQDSRLVKMVWARMVRVLGVGDAANAKQISRFSDLLTERYRTTAYFMNR